MVYRMFCLQSHYRRALVFSYENLDNAKTAYQKLIARIAALHEDGEVDSAVFDQQRAGFVRAMDNDLNTSLAVTALYDALKAPANDATKLALIREYDSVLCLNLLENAQKLRQEPQAPAADEELIRQVEAMIAARAEAKKAKNYAEADRIRAALAEKGVTLKDTKEGTEYSIS